MIRSLLLAAIGIAVLVVLFVTSPACSGSDKPIEEPRVRTERGKQVDAGPKSHPKHSHPHPHPHPPGTHHHHPHPHPHLAGNDGHHHPF